jgi:dinuclear metal center YbgI/SA1388 family protein
MPRSPRSGPAQHPCALYPAGVPARLHDIVRDLDRLLEPERFTDYGPNGLQVPGADAVTAVATGVSAQLELFERARAEGAELVLVHHGLFWGTPGPIDDSLARRLRVLLAADISLLAYHLPLDAHAEVGNNALLARALEAELLAPFAPHRGTPIGFLAELPGDGLPIGELLARIERVTARVPLAFDFGPPLVRRLGIVSGGGANHLADAIAAGADAFLTGEPAERVMAEAREAGVHFIAAGHYATETFGVARLGERLSERFGVRHVFVDIPNPV